MISWAIPHLIYDAFRNQTTALQSYGVIWSALPLLSLLSCFGIATKYRMDSIAVWPALWFVFFGFLSFGFPTEVWVMQAVYWPTLLLALLSFYSWPAIIMLSILFDALAFSHEAMLLLLPALGAAIVFNTKASWFRKLFSSWFSRGGMQSLASDKGLVSSHESSSYTHAQG